MRRIPILLLLLAALPVPAAERVVLVEDFTNSGCNPCWVLEPTLNPFVDSHLASGDIAMIRVHVNWPSPTDPIYLANPTEQTARKTFYNVSSVPMIWFDGVIVGTYNLEGSWTTRSNVPSYLDILVCRNGGDLTGTLSIRLIAEQELGNEAPLRLFCTITEDDVPGAGYWSGTVFEQAFRDNVFGVVGPLVEFSAPYPDTVFFEAPYNTAGWVAANLNVATFVQEYALNQREVMNARYDNFLGLSTGIEGQEGAEPAAAVLLDANPCGGTFSGTVAVPEGTGTLDVYDLSGRKVMSLDVTDGGTVSGELPGTGVYLLRLSAPGGSVSTASLVSI